MQYKARVYVRKSAPAEAPSTARTMATDYFVSEADLTEEFNPADFNTAIDNISIGDSKAEYFTLQGIRVNASEVEKGVCIRVKDGKAEIIMMK